MTENNKADEVPAGSRPRFYSKGDKMPRREFLKKAAVSATALAISELKRKTGVINAFSVSEKPEGSESSETHSRKETFKPFGEGIEWQYVAFQYQNKSGEQEGVVISLTTVNKGDFFSVDRLLVMCHNLDTKESYQKPYEGKIEFDEQNSKYIFKDDKGNTLVSYEYQEDTDNYQLFVDSEVFKTSDIDEAGLILQPVSPLIFESADGNFPIAKYPDGTVVETNYYSDNLVVKKPSSLETIGHGSRDSENVVANKIPSTSSDFDHNFAHCAVELEDGRIAFIKAWEGKTGGDFKFTTIEVENEAGSGDFERVQFNEEIEGFELAFETKEEETETMPSGKKLPHGFSIKARFNDQPLFDLDIDGDPKQIIGDGSKFFGEMVEAHGKVSGTILGVPIAKSLSALSESTDEIPYKVFAPSVQNE